jgi:hypothetical protein
MTSPPRLTPRRKRLLDLVWIAALAAFPLLLLLRLLDQGPLGWRQAAEVVGMSLVGILVSVAIWWSDVLRSAPDSRRRRDPRKPDAE